MNIFKTLFFVAMVGFFSFQVSAGLAGWKDVVKGVENIIGKEGLSEDKIIQGLKEALEVGTDNVVASLSKANGYYQNPKIRIPMPEAVEKVQGLLKGVGYGPQLDAFEKSMNRAAEKAAPEAKALFWDAIKKMSFEDAKEILKGKDDAATLYFKEKTWDPLQETFQPMVHGAMAEVGVTRSYQAIESKVNSFPLRNTLDFNLDEYVTTKALDGLFLMLAEEERKIREEPAARVTDLLQEVFGSGK